jgi:hypothetical protein
MLTLRRLPRELSTGTVPKRSWGSSVGIVTRLLDGRVQVRSQQELGGGFLLFATGSRPALRPTQVASGSSPRGKTAGA